MTAQNRDRFCKRILVVDDEEASRQSARQILQNIYTVELADNAEKCLRLLSEHSFDLILMDLKMPGIGGLTGLKRIRSVFTNIPVIMMTAFQSVSTAVETMKLGACDYLVKPFDLPSLREVVARNIGTFYSTQLESCGNLLAQSPCMLKIFSTIHNVADKDVTVLITGESGTGKELVAEAVHGFSHRQNKPFVIVNCAAIPESLIESELFGHERGAFTHAERRRLGQFEIAHGGTIFLDEIGELSPGTQSKLLRVIQNRSFYRVGGNEEIHVDVRLLAATNRNLEMEVKNHQFREDLYYRLNVVHLEIPPLRQRKDDILPLAEHFLGRHTRELNTPPKRLSAEVADFLKNYPWPGNVRELVNVMERITVLSQQQEILPGDLPKHFSIFQNQSDSAQDELFKGEEPFQNAISQLEQKLICAALEKAHGIQTNAASILGISRRILKYKMDKLGIEGPLA
jgi:DNA-binding NtrC family response regulator